jgi:hypothetical protein
MLGTHAGWICLTLLTQAAPPPSPQLSPEEQALVALLGDSIKVVPSDAVLDREAIRRRTLAPEEAEFQVVHGPSVGTTIRRSVGPVARTPDHWPVADGKPIVVTLPGRSAVYIFLDDEGKVLAEAQLDLEHGVLVSFSPGEMRLPDRVDPTPYQMKVKVWDLHDPGELEHEGSMTVTGRDRGTWSVTTPAGTFDCVLYRLDYDGNVGPASVRDTTLRFISPKYGLVAAIDGKRVSAMLFYNTDERFAFVLEDHPRLETPPVPPASPGASPSDPRR